MHKAEESGTQVGEAIEEFEFVESVVRPTSVLILPAPQEPVHPT